MPTLPPVALPSGNPHPGNLYLMATLIQSLYAEDRACAQAVADFYNMALPFWQVDPATFPVDVAVIVGQGTGIVVMGGTTNSPQWVAHCGGAVLCVPDGQSPAHSIGTNLVNPSFLIGCTLIEHQIDNALEAIGTAGVRIAGHSYGGAAAYILGRHLKSATPPQQRVDLVTFGEPKSYDAREPKFDVDYHARLIASVLPPVNESGQEGVDPVTLLPFSVLGFLSISKLFTISKNVIGFHWGHWGQGFLLVPNQTIATNLTLSEQAALLLPHASPTFVLLNLLNGALHLMASSYLATCQLLWLSSGLSPELSFLNSFANRYIQTPTAVEAFLGPALKATLVNAAIAAAPETPVTDADLVAGLWQSVSAVGYYVSPQSSKGAEEMTLLKGSMLFNSIQGGFSESVYSSNPSETITSMITKMQALLQARSVLSVTDKSSYNPSNPIIPQAMRISDALSQRAGFNVSISGGGYGSYPVGSVPGSAIPGVTGNNLDLELGARITFSSGAPRQSAAVTLHGMPVDAFASVTAPGFTPSIPLYSSEFLREARPSALWTTQLINYVNTLINNGLGFRVITGAWNNASTGQPGAYSTPSAVFYNASQQMVELNWTTNPPVWPTSPAQLAGQCPMSWPTGGSNPHESPTGTLGAVCRLQVRKWAGFQTLNGRWAAQVVAPQTGFLFALRILRRCRQLPGTPLTGSMSPFPTGYPLPVVSPIAWTVWVPGGGFVPPITNVTAANPNLAVIAGFDYVESKKLGRDFELQRGRARNRAT